MQTGLTVHARRLKIGWGKNSGPTSPGIAMVVQAGGSRNVYVGGLDLEVHTSVGFASCRARILMHYRTS